jgi:hypothetical protein
MLVAPSERNAWESAFPRRLLGRVGRHFCGLLSVNLIAGSDNSGRERSGISHFDERRTVIWQSQQTENVTIIIRGNPAPRGAIRAADLVAKFPVICGGRTANRRGFSRRPTFRTAWTFWDPSC